MELLRGGDSGHIAVAVATVIGAARGDVFALGRLRELPDFREADSALGWAWRVTAGIYGKSAARRGRASVIDGPVDDLARAGALANVFCGDNVAVIRGGDAGAVDAGAESGGGNGIDPGVDVGFLLGQHASALLLVEEDDGMRGKTFAVRGGGGGFGVGAAELRCAGDGFQFCVEAAVEEHEETEAGGLDGGAMAGPGVRFLSGRIV